MNSLEITLYGILIACIIFLASFFMEIYKKIIRKNKCKDWECRLIGAVLSIGCVLLLYFTGALYPIFNKILGAYIWVDYLMYIILFYFSQLKLDMLVIKRIVRALVKCLIKNIGLDKGQVEIIIQAIEEKNRQK